MYAFPGESAETRLLGPKDIEEQIPKKRSLFGVTLESKCQKQQALEFIFSIPEGIPLYFQE